MRGAARFVVVAVVLVGCGGKGGEAGSGAGPASGGGPAEPAAQPGFTKEKAQGIVDGVALGEGWEPGLKKVESDGFFLTWRGPKNDRGANPNVIATGTACSMGMCTELTADAWKAKSDNLKMKLSAELKATPDLVFEVAEETVEGKKVVAVYTLGYLEKTSDSGTSRVSSHSYDLYWHDGAKLVSVMTSAGATGAQSRADLETKMTRAELQAAGHKVLGAIFAKL